jgi:hypothetical protein
MPQVVRPMQVQTVQTRPTHRQPVGIYTNPNHVMAYDDGEVRQQCSICFTTKLLGGQLATSSETSEVEWVAPERLNRLNIHPSMRLRIDHYLEQRSEPYIG